MRTLAMLVTAASVLLLSCSPGPTKPADVCIGFPDWRSSPYLLPYPAGVAWEVNQANCSGEGHCGFWRYGYDFSMPIGTVVTAARDGVVGWSRGQCEDSDGGCTNLVTVIHPDGDVTVYSHLTKGGALVPAGARVAAGVQRVAWTSGSVGLPHASHDVLEHGPEPRWAGGPPRLYGPIVWPRPGRGAAPATAARYLPGRTLAPAGTGEGDRCS